VLSHLQWLEINDLILLINRTEDLKMMRLYFLDAVRLILPYDKAVFYLFTEEENGIITLKEPVFKNLSTEAVKEYERLINSDVMGRRVMNLRRTTEYRSSDLIQQVQSAAGDFFTKNNIFWYSGIVMADKDILLGEVIFYRSRDKNDFSDTDLEILNILKDHFTLRLSREKDKCLTVGRVNPLTALGLTERECEITELIMRKFSIEEISDKLVISPYTTKKHINHIYCKLHVKNRLQLLDVVRNCKITN